MDFVTAILVFVYETLVYPVFSVLYGAFLTQEYYSGIAQFNSILLALDAVGIMYLYVLLDKTGVFQPASEKHVISWYTIPARLGARSNWVFLFILLSLAYCAYAWWLVPK